MSMGYLIVFESLVLVMVVYILIKMLYYKIEMDIEMISPYECGFDSGFGSRTTFSYRFFLISILFIIFDVEISLMLPIPFVMNSILGVWMFMLFLFVLVVGLIYEYYCGALDWLDTVSKA